MESPHRLGLVAAARALANGELSSVALTRSCLERVAAREPGIGAFAWLDGRRAMAAAEAADARRREGAALGPLHGLPLGVKDVVPTRGVPTELGSAVFRGHVPALSASVVDRLERAGAFVLGKTVTAELAFLTPGPTRNPWNPAHTPGGSSSGSAAAVAAGFCPGAIGTQTNGSVIRPAAFCGVVGFKPTQGSIAFDGIPHFSPSLDQLGVFARSVADAAWLASALADAPGTVPAVPCEIDRPPRLLAVRTPVWERATALQRARFEADQASLARAGAQIEARELPASFAQAHAVLNRIMLREGASSIGALVGARRAALSPALRAALAEGAAVSDDQLAEARAIRIALRRAFAGFVDDADAVLTPPAPGEAPASLASTGDPGFCTIWTLLGAPALAIPTGLGAAGLPIGLQIVGAEHRDDQALAVAAWCASRLAFSGLAD